MNVKLNWVTKLKSKVRIWYLDRCIKNNFSEIQESEKLLNDPFLYDDHAMIEFEINDLRYLNRKHRDEIDRLTEKLEGV